MTWKGYFAVEDLNLSVAQRALLVDALKLLGPGTARQPAHLNHWRVALAGDKAIFEAAFNEAALTVDVFKQRLGAIFGVDPATIDHALSSVTFVDRPTPVVMFSHGGTDYLRFALFGGPGADWNQSRIEVLVYLAANRAEWEEEL